MRAQVTGAQPVADDRARGEAAQVHGVDRADEDFSESARALHERPAAAEF